MSCDKDAERALLRAPRALSPSSLPVWPRDLGAGDSEALRALRRDLEFVAEFVGGCVGEFSGCSKRKHARKPGAPKFSA